MVMWKHDNALNSKGIGKVTKGDISKFNCKKCKILYHRKKGYKIKMHQENTRRTGLINL